MPKKGLDKEPRKMLGSSSYEFNTTMECRDRDDDSVGGGGYNNINLLRNGRGKRQNAFYWEFR